MPSDITYGQLRRVLAGLGFKEKTQAEGVALEHPASDTLFLFRPYQENDRLQWAEVSFVRKQLDERGLLEPASFETLLTRAPA
jgi:hypothetical protein